MPILKTIATQNGLVNAVRIDSMKLAFRQDPVEGQELMFDVQLNMFATIEALRRNDGILWQEYLQVPVSAIDPADPFGSLERWLLAEPEGRFSGGDYVPEVATSDLEDAKLIKWAQIKSRRDQEESNGFVVEGVGTFDSDVQSRTNIIGAALAAKIKIDASEPFSIDWTTRDNTVVPLTAEQAIGLGFDMFTHLDATHQHSRQLFTQIQDATTVEEVNTINW